MPFQIIGDTVAEADRSLPVHFTNPDNATIGGFSGLGALVITDDD